MKALKENYKRNVEILNENLRRGMSIAQAMSVVKAWREQFVSNNLYGDDEKNFINACLEVIEPNTKLKIREM